MAAFLVFYLLPLAVALVYARFNYLLSTEWIFRSLPIMLVVAYLIKLTIAGLIYLWSVRRERGSFGAASASPAANFEMRSGGSASGITITTGHIVSIE